ncbi:MAG: glycine cleavage system aminomethyltransferase GcvT [Gemmatimonadetes bacterium]|nr:glycine cleavage system aminomethyltransferase GcvT [Gemmatimonadota bacterium]
MKTPLHDRHVAAGARMADFAGFDMPISYDGILAEHRRVREAAGLFDVSHMGEAEVRGAAAHAFLDFLLTNDVSAVPPHHAQYTLMLNRQGGVIDDLILYRLQDRYLLVVNAANVAKDFEWIGSHLAKDVDFRNVSDRTALLAWQGPKAAAILDPLVGADLSAVPSFGIVETRLEGIAVILARTGYTGEDGFEIFVDPARAAQVWDRLLEAGAPHGAGPAGLGARDTLRLEKQYRLYGQDMDETVSALEAGLGWTVKLDKGDFLGRDALLAQREAGIPRATIGLLVTEPGRHIPRAGCVVMADGREVGEVTSGTFSPSREEGIALARVPKEFAAKGDLTIRIRNRDVAVKRVKKSFV